MMIARAVRHASRMAAAARRSTVPLVSSRAASFWSSLEMGPPDPILDLTAAFNSDPAEQKILLGAGAYRDDSGKPFVLPSVREAEKVIFESLVDHEYAPISGPAKFLELSRELALGSGSEICQSGYVASAQTISGTGANRLFGEFVKKFVGAGTPIFFPTPTWGNHGAIFRNAGLEPVSYRYYDKATNGLDFSGMAEDLKNAPSGSVLLLHTCAHNPTGVDPTPAQWDELSSICKEKEHICFFDTAYQGFASGDPNKDGYSLRKFIADGNHVAFAQSFAKNFGLYGERAGALHVVCNDPANAKATESQLKLVIRPMYSNPPVYGARIVTTVLNDSGLRAQWHADLQTMASRIMSMRQELVSHLAAAGSTHDWSHIVNQIGMFCFTGLNKEQVEKLKSDYHIYMTGDGRISVSGITTANVGYLAESIHALTK